MPVIYNNGTLNISNYPPGVIVDVQAPQPNNIQGLSTNTIRLVGTSSFGALNQPTPVQDYATYSQIFGPALNEAFDMGSFILLAQQKYANNFVCVRVSDGTGLVASVNVMDTAGTPAIGLVITSKYTGTTGNTIQVIVGTGSNSKSGSLTYKISIELPGGLAEVFDNIAGTGAALWAAMASAINNGQSQQTGPSQLVVASVGAGTAAPNKTTYTLAGGTNGNSGVTASTLVGTDTAPPTGMYALRGNGIGTGCLVGCTDSTTFAAQEAFGLEEGNYMVGSGPIGQTSAAAITAIQTAAIESSAFKYLVGDWEYWFDSVNNLWRYSTQQAAAAGLFSTLNPPESGLNKPINTNNTMITQRSIAKQPYTAQEIINLRNAGVDVIAYNRTLGDYFALQTGVNTSQPINYLTGGDNYSRLTPYIAFSLQKGLAQFIGKLLDPEIEKDAYCVIANFLKAMELQNWIGDVNGGKAFSIVISAEDSVLIADVQVVMFSVIVNVLVNLQNGVTQINPPVSNNSINRARLNLL